MKTAGQMAHGIQVRLLPQSGLHPRNQGLALGQIHIQQHHIGQMPKGQLHGLPVAGQEQQAPALVMQKIGHRPAQLACSPGD